MKIDYHLSRILATVALHLDMGAGGGPRRGPQTPTAEAAIKRPTK